MCILLSCRRWARNGANTPLSPTGHKCRLRMRIRIRIRSVLHAAPSMSRTCAENAASFSMVVSRPCCIRRRVRSCLKIQRGASFDYLLTKMWDGWGLRHRKGWPSSRISMWVGVAWGSTSWAHVAADTLILNTTPIESWQSRNCQRMAVDIPAALPSA